MEQLKPSSLQFNAYREIKRRIVTSAYRPGEQLNTARISTELGIGRTPVHLAIHRLELEGMIEIVPRRGVVVKPVDRAEIMELIEARMVVEPEVAALAALRASECEFAAMRAILDRIPRPIERRDSERFMEADREFHDAIARAARNRPLGDLLTRLHERCSRVYFISATTDEQDVRIVTEHDEIFTALVSRDAAAAADMVRRHIESLRASVRRALAI